MGLEPACAERCRARIAALEEQHARDHDRAVSHDEQLRRYCALLDSNGQSIPSRLTRLEGKVDLMLWVLATNALAGIGVLYALVFKPYAP